MNNLLPKHVKIKTVDTLNKYGEFKEYTVINGKKIDMQDTADNIANKAFKIIGCEELINKFDLQSGEFTGMYLPEFLEYVLKTYATAPYIIDHLPDEDKISKELLLGDFEY